MGVALSTGPAPILPTSIRTAMQEREIARRWVSGKLVGTQDPALLTVAVRYDDRCKNGYNTFSITAKTTGKGGKELCGGAMHDTIRSEVPEYAHLLEWHLCSSNGPLHYVANSLYHIRRVPASAMYPEKVPDLEAARSCAIWPDAEEEDFTERKLLGRLPMLMMDFKYEMEKLGFVY